MAICTALLFSVKLLLAAKYNPMASTQNSISSPVVLPNATRGFLESNLDCFENTGCWGAAGTICGATGAA